MRAVEAEFLRKWKDSGTPGATFCVAKNGKVLLSRGYGYANSAKKIPMQPDSILRIASLSKAVTATLVLRLCQQGKLRLDDKAFAILGDIRPSMPQTRPDPRLETITVRQLLTCTAGWNPSQSADPFFGSTLREVSSSTKNLRATPIDVVRFWINRPLDFDPGTQYAYNNISFAVLGELIQKVTGKPYSEFLASEITKQFNLPSLQVGQTVPRSAKEAAYYPSESMAQSVYPNVGKPVSAAYGGDFAMEALAPTAGLVASAPDLVRFGQLLLHGDLLNKEYLIAMSAKPSCIPKIDAGEYFGMGFEIGPSVDGSAAYFARHGCLAGSMSSLVCRKDGYVWSALFNGRPVGYNDWQNDLHKSINRMLGGQTTGMASLPSAGTFEPSMKKLDEIFQSAMIENRIPGGAIYVLKNNKAVMNRAYGWADQEHDKKAKTDSLFRIASISKPLTAIAVLKLCNEKKLNLSDKVFQILPDYLPPSKALQSESRLREITVKQLMQCTAGWNHELRGDPLFGSTLMEAANASNKPLPDALSLARYWLTNQVDEKPGSKFNYSNFSYLLLGEIIARKSGKPYTAYIQEQVLAPLRLAGIYPGTTGSARDNEVRYYPTEQGRAAMNGNVAYGGDFLLEPCMASIGFVGNTAALTRLVDSVSADKARSIIGPQGFAEMFAKPTCEPKTSTKEYFGMGWEVQRDKNGRLREYSRHGSLAGSMALAVRRSDGITWAALWNSRPANYPYCREQIKERIDKFLDTLNTSSAIRSKGKPQ